MATQVQNPNIDIGLSVLCAIAEPGESLTQTEIAHVCECSRDAIWKIEKRALAKASRLALDLHLQDFLED